MKRNYCMTVNSDLEKITRPCTQLLLLQKECQRDLDTGKNFVVVFLDIKSVVFS